VNAIGLGHWQLGQGISNLRRARLAAQTPCLNRRLEDRADDGGRRYVEAAGEIDQGADPPVRELPTSAAWI
jgi:hypothetical protein